MATTTTTPLMGLILPVVGTQVGPTWASNLNTALETVDTHDHTTGKGSKIPTAALLINADLSTNNKSVYDLLSTKFINNTSPLNATTYPTSINVSSGELYYNDAAGNQIQLTAAGGINLTSIGTIGGDYSTSTASLAYSSLSTTFAFTSSSGIYSKVNLGDLKIYERVSGGKFVQLKTPTGLGADYTLVMPTALPSSTLPMKLDASGNISSSLIQASDLGPFLITASMLDTNSVITSKILDSNVTTNKINNSAVTTAKIANGNVTLGKQADVNFLTNGNTVTYTSSTYALEEVTGTEITLTVLGRNGGAGGTGKVMLMLKNQHPSLPSYVRTTIPIGSQNVQASVYFYADGVSVACFDVGFVTNQSTGTLRYHNYPTSSFSTFIDSLLGDRTYKVYVENFGGSGTISLTNYEFVAYEV